MRMEGGTRLAFLSFCGVQNARTLVVRGRAHVQKRVAARARPVTRAAVAAAGWRGCKDGWTPPGPLARWLGPRGSSVACSGGSLVRNGRDTRLARVQIAARERQRFVTVCVEPVQAGRRRQSWRRRAEMVEGGAAATSRIWGWTSGGALQGVREAAALGRRRSLPSCRVAPLAGGGGSQPPIAARVISDRGGAREAALSTVDFEEVQLRTRRPLPASGRSAASVLGARIDSIERLINGATRLRRVGLSSVGGVGARLAPARRGRARLQRRPFRRARRLEAPARAPGGAGSEPARSFGAARSRRGDRVRTAPAVHRGRGRPGCVGLGY